MSAREEIGERVEEVLSRLPRHTQSVLGGFLDRPCDLLGMRGSFVAFVVDTHVRHPTGLRRRRERPRQAPAAARTERRRRASEDDVLDSAPLSATSASR
jgi:hypothetical protein